MAGRSRDRVGARGVALGAPRPFARPQADWVRVPVDGAEAPEATRALEELAERTGGWLEGRRGGHLEVVAPATRLAGALKDGGVLGAPAAPWPVRPLWRAGSLSVVCGGRVAVMAVLNVTPDSFTDGGRWLDPSRAFAQAGRLARQGADVLDIGGESTRPGHAPVAPELEWQRLAPVLDRLRASYPLPLSVDTRHGEVARRALAAGCTLVNDVTGGEDPALLDAVAASGAPVVLGHWSRPSATARDVVARVLDELGAAVARATAGGVAESAIAVDPGFGFGKGADANWMLLRHLPALRELNRPVVVGLSRKGFLTAISGQDLAARDQATAAAVALAVEGGADMVRVHEPERILPAVRVAERFAGRDGGQGS